MVTMFTLCCVFGCLGCPLMTGYEGGDLLLTGAAWPMVGSLRKPVCAGCGWRPAAPVSDESAFEVA